MNLRKKRNLNNSKTNQPGAVLPLVLIILSVITTLSFTMAYRAKIELTLAKNYAQRTQCHYLAIAGIERLKALIISKDLAEQNLSSLGRFNSDAASEDLFQSCSVSDTLKNAQLRYCLRDEYAYFNLNNSDPAAWQKLGLSTTLCAAILDWVDQDDDINPDGAETDDYQRLSLPYRAKNKEILTLKELLFVNSVTADIYLGISPYSDMENSWIDSIFKPAENVVAQNESVSLLNAFTVYGDGKININTAAEHILAALPGLNETTGPVISTYLAGGDAVLGTEDDNQIKTAADIEKIGAIGQMQIELLQQYCRFDSEHFRVFSYAKLPSGSDCCFMGVVGLGEDQMRLLSLELLR
ncbi:MAG: type II secretion system minor pseudopilin [Planctomycetota bacterium]|jgi:type II secretory pathway component PulK